ncbi:Uncharacterised protein [Chlamydia trachomatis]|nr:Uncharacterised protein [Chlamydia trachomatis]
MDNHLQKKQRFIPIIQMSAHKLFCHETYITFSLFSPFFTKK